MANLSSLRSICAAGALGTALGFALGQSLPSIGSLVAGTSRLLRRNAPQASVSCSDRLATAQQIPNAYEGRPDEASDLGLTPSKDAKLIVDQSGTDKCINPCPAKHEVNDWLDQQESWQQDSLGASDHSGLNGPWHTASDTADDESMLDDDTASESGSDTTDISDIAFQFPASGRAADKGHGEHKAFSAFPSHFGSIADTTRTRRLCTGRPAESSLPEGVSYVQDASQEQNGIYVLRPDWKGAEMISPDGRCTFVGSQQLTITDKRDGSMWTCAPEWKLQSQAPDVSQEEVDKLQTQLQRECDEVMSDRTQSQRVYYLGRMMEGRYADAIRSWYMSIPTWSYLDAAAWAEDTGRSRWTVKNIDELEDQYGKAERQWTNCIVHITSATKGEPQEEQEDFEIKYAKAKLITIPRAPNVGAGSNVSLPEPVLEPSATITNLSQDWGPTVPPDESLPSSPVC